MARHASDFELLRFDDAFEGSIRFDEPMARHTTYRIGGPARVFAEVRSIAALNTVLRICLQENLDWCVVGKGANLLVSDKGYNGVVITLSGEFRKWHFDEDASSVIVGAGTILARLVQEAFHRGYSGMEFAVGIPGTVGGALHMNAGTRDDWIGSRVKTVTTVVAGKGLTRYSQSEIEWGYRRTSFRDDEIIVEVELELTKALSENIHENMAAALSKRKQSQPLELPSCGSVFRNPEGASVGALIEQADLKGKTIGGAQISEKHANFIVNKQAASAQDVCQLIKLAKQAVKEQHGIELTTEVQFLGFEDDSLSIS